MRTTRPDMEIASPANARIKALVKLRDRAARDREGLVLIEGYRELLRALKAGVKPAEVYFCEAFFLGANEPALLEQARAAGARLIALTKTPFAKASYRDRPDGLLAVAPKIGRPLEAIPLSPSPLIVLAVNIEKPGNLGMILRSADAVGADGVVVADGKTDVNNPNVVRASTGTLFSMPIAEAGAEETLAWLKRHGIRLLAATPHSELGHTEADLTGPVAIALGAEQYGLTSRWLEAAELKVRIPMAGVADSLNVGAAATVLLFEAARQRGFANAKPDFADESAPK
ncbi:MAG: RNA methyltransferase [Myxococcales bacterium]|nr:MAG: RNA methyltransferase [Myxococcales bacterium]